MPTRSRWGMLFALALLLLSRASAASECKIEELQADAWQAAEQVATGTAPDLAPLVVKLLTPLWNSECQLMPEKAEVQVVDACQSKVSRWLGGWKRRAKDGRRGGGGRLSCRPPPLCLLPFLQTDPLLFALLADVALPCKNGTEKAAIVAGQIVLELTTAAEAGNGA